MDSRHYFNQAADQGDNMVRILKPGGKLVINDLNEHRQELDHGFILPLPLVSAG